MKRNTNKREKGKIRDSIIVFSDFMQSLIFICSIVNAVMAPVIEKVKEVEFPRWIDNYATFFNTASIEYLVNCAIMVFFIIKLVVVITHENKKRNEEVISVMDCLHIDYIHDMRNHIHQLEKTKNLISGIDISKDLEDFESWYNREYKILENVAQRCVNQVSDIINDCMGMPNNGASSICACIKMVSIYEKDKPISKRSLITLARSQNSSWKRRKKAGKNIIGKNSDFLDLSEGYRNYYYGINLKDKYKQGIYNNSTPNFSYESTVVVPIRFSDLHSDVSLVPVSNKKKRVEIKIKSDVDIVGYLCIDSEKILYEWENHDEVEKIVKILALYADSLYVYLSAFRSTFTVQKHGGKK